MESSPLPVYEEWILAYVGSDGLRHGATSGPRWDQPQKYPSQELRDFCVKMCKAQEANLKAEGHQ